MIVLPEPLIIVGKGAKTAVGLTADATYAAMRAGISGFKETTYISLHGKPITGAPVPGIIASDLDVSYLADLAESPIAECLKSLEGINQERIGLFFGLERLHSSIPVDSYREKLQNEIESKLQVRFGTRFKIFPQDEMSFASSIVEASRVLKQGAVDSCLVGGAQTLLRADRLKAFEEKNRLKTGRNSDGLIPGEAGAFIAVARNSKKLPATSRMLSEIKSVVLITENDLKKNRTKKFQAWTEAIRQAVAFSNIDFKDIGFRPTNISGEHKISVEAGIAIMRNFLKPMPLPQAWYIAGSIGTVGAGVGALLAGWSVAAFEKGYGKGCASLCELASDEGFRSAILIGKRGGQNHTALSH